MDIVKNREAVNQLYLKGIHRIAEKEYAIAPNYFDFVKNVESRRELFEQNGKNAGSITLNLNLSETQEIKQKMIDMIFDSGLMKQVIETTGIPLYLTNFIHMITRAADDELLWHRDIYYWKNSGPVGLMPAPYKLMVYNSEVTKSSEFEVLAGTHKIDFNSKLFDKFLTTIKYKSNIFRGKPGSAMIFHTSALHRRRKPRAGFAPRSATVFGLAPTPWQQELYLPKHATEIKRYNEHLNELKKEISWLP